MPKVYPELTCRYCNKTFRPYRKRPNPRIFCSVECRKNYQRGENHPSYKGGYIDSTHGYKSICGVLEHRIVMERLLGRPLRSDEIVHHKDENRLNNDPSNLVLTNRSEHQRLHANFHTETHKICCICKELKPKTEYHKDRTHYDGLRSQCKVCSIKWQHEYKAKKIS